MNKHKIKAFTLVELIVVVTILAILSTIWFVSYSWYLAWTRDASRVANIKALADWLKMYSTKNALPKPESNVSIYSWATLIAWQWYASQWILETIEFSNWWKDPKYDTYFSYYLTKNKKYFQLMWFLEEAENLQTNVLSNTYAAVDDYSVLFPTVYGDKLGILTDSGNIPLPEIASIWIWGSLDISSVSLNLKSFLKDNEYVDGTSTDFAKLWLIAEDWGKLWTVELNAFTWVTVQ